MITYPFEIEPTTFPRRTSKLEAADTAQNSGDVGTRGCDAKKKCILSRIELKAVGKSSTSFDATSDDPLPTTADQRFHFAPGHDDVEMTWHIENKELAEGGTLSLYAAHDSNPIWTQVLEKADVQELSRGKPWQGELPNPTDAFPGGLVTVERSPYLLELKIDGSTEEGRARAWTVFDVIVHDISLSWGIDAHIPENRADVPLSSAAEAMSKNLEKPLDKASLEAQLLERQKALLKAIEGVKPDRERGGSDFDLELDFSAFDQILNDLKSDFEFSRDLWGDGPMLPIMAQVRVRDVNDKGVLEPKALGQAPFIWEWRDNDDLSRDDFLKAQLGDAADPSDDVSPITRRYLETVVDSLRNPKFPSHAYNCPGIAGGKRGIESPGVDRMWVIPPWKPDGRFPFLVRTDLEKRRWASVSYADPSTDVKDREGRAVQTGILFQPSHVAGDRYRLTVYSAAAGRALDVDLDQDAWIDLEREAKDVPQASTPWFTIWRKLNATILHMHSFKSRTPELIRAIQERFKRELGYVIDFQSKDFPDLSKYRDELVESEILSNTSLNSKASNESFFRNSVDPSPRPANLDYAFPVRCPDGLPADLSPIGTEYPVFAMRFETWLPVDTPDLKARDWVKVTGAESGAQALVAPKPRQKLEGFLLALALNAARFQDGENVRFEGKRSTPEHRDAMGEGKLTKAWVYRDGPVRIEDETRKLKDRIIVVGVDDAAKSGIQLDYPEGKRATRQLNDTRKAQLDQLAIEAMGARTRGAEIVFRVAGNRSGTRAKQRAQNVVDYLERFVGAPKCSDLMTSFASSYEKPRKDLSEYWRHVVRSAIKKWAYEDAKDIEDNHRVYFSLQRGFTTFDKKFVTGGIESDISTLQVGVASVSVPALEGEGAMQQRWLKDVDTVSVHEFGHALALKHSSPRLMDSKPASGVFEYHLPHDICLMNYDADTSSFCAYCMLRKRGWKYEGLAEHAPIKALGDPHDVGWVKTCIDLMKQRVDANQADFGWRVRYAMFLISLGKYLDGAQIDLETCDALMDEVLNGIPKGDDHRVWALRNYLFYVDKKFYFEKFNHEVSLTVSSEKERLDEISALITKKNAAYKEETQAETEHEDVMIVKALGEVDGKHLLDERIRARKAQTGAIEEQARVFEPESARVQDHVRPFVDELLETATLPLDFEDIVDIDATPPKIKLESQGVALWQHSSGDDNRSKRMP